MNFLRTIKIIFVSDSMYKACKHIIEFFCLCFSVFCSSHSISKSSVEVNLSTWMISSVSSSPSQLVLQEGSLRLVYKLNELAVETISRIGSPLWFNSFLFLAASISCRSNSCFLRSLTLSSLAFSATTADSFAVEDSLCFCVVSTDGRNPAFSFYFLCVLRALVLGL